MPFGTRRLPRSAHSRCRVRHGPLRDSSRDPRSTVWGVDASSEMLAQARAQVPGGVELREARAEALPFEDSRFEGAVAWLVLHLVDRGRALPELRRVLRPDGRAVVVTFPPEYFERIWLARFFPSLVEIDRARFPEPEVLADELRAAGFARVQTRSIEQRATISREDALRDFVSGTSRRCYCFRRTSTARAWPEPSTSSPTSPNTGATG